jgi:hypothetical protein
MDGTEMRSDGGGEGTPVVLLGVAATMLTGEPCQALGVDEAFQIWVVVAGEGVKIPES